MPCSIFWTLGWFCIGVSVGVTLSGLYDVYKKRKKKRIKELNEDEE